MKVSFAKEPYKRDYTMWLNKSDESYRVAWSHRMPYLQRSFFAKEPYNWWLFCEK